METEVKRFELPPGTEVIKSKNENGEPLYRWQDGSFLPSEIGEMLETRYSGEE